MKRYLFFLFLLSIVFFISVPALADSTDLDVNALIDYVKNAMVEAQNKAAIDARRSKKPRYRISKIELEVSCIVKKEGNGSVKMYVVTAGAEYSKELVQHIKYELEPEGKQYVEFDQPIRGIIVGVDPVVGKIFITPEGDSGTKSIPIEVKADTKITDLSGKSKTLCEVKAGMPTKLTGGLRPDGSYDVKTIMLGQ